MLLVDIYLLGAVIAFLYEQKSEIKKMLPDKVAIDNNHEQQCIFYIWAGFHKKRHFKTRDMSAFSY